MKKITIGILETGLLPTELENNFSSFPSMFQALLNDCDSQLSFETYSVLKLQFPESINSCDAWLITGSKHAAYENHPWTEPLCQLIREAYQTDVPLIGICFGHQIICHALGGVVEKSQRGWGLGATAYTITDTPSWMKNTAKLDTFTIQAFHQDQVLRTPANTQVIASSDECTNAALNINNKALTFQGHPEFNTDFSEALLSSKRDLKIIPATQANDAIKNISTPLNQQQVGRWICEFLRFKLQ